MRTRFRLHALVALAAVALTALTSAACESAGGGAPGVDTIGAADAADTGDPRVPDVPVAPADAASDAGPPPETGPAPAPRLQVSPAAGVDFGAVALGIGARREVTFTNAGTADLTIESLTIEPGVDTDTGEFAFETPPAGAIRLRPGASHARALTFHNERGGTGPAAAQLVVRSDDPTTPEVALPLSATRSAAPTCAAVLEPQPLDFGAVAAGDVAEATVRLRNAGSGRCGYVAAAAFDCPPAPNGGWSCPTTEPSPWFAVIDQPEPSADGLGPGQSAELRVRFTPSPDAPPAAAEDIAYAGWLQVTLRDPYAPDGADDAVLVPPLPPGAAAPNVTGRVPSCLLRLSPPAVDLGTATVGCASEAFPVEAWLPCTAVARVTSVTLDEGCAPDFALVVPPLPAEGREVRPGAPLLVAAQFTPTAAGPAECVATFLAAPAPGGEPRPVGFFTLRGVGTEATTQVDTFTGGARPADVLFVVDDSGSMCETQERLVRDLPALVTTLQAAAADVRIGVIDVCADEADGCPAPGRLRSTRYVAPDWSRWVTQGALAALGSQLDLGCEGPSSREAGLAAAARALTPPLTTLSETTCADDGECAEASPDGGGECLRDLERCGGFNAGFLREDADLHVVLVSDEDDQSDGPVEGYLQTYAGLKAGVPAAAVRVHAIVGDPETGCETVHGLAEAGDRYAAAAAATGGVLGSICAPSYGDPLADIAASVAGPRRSFDLSRVPDPDTLAVALDGTPCAAGWSWDAASNRIVFDPVGPCVPTSGRTVTVTYDAACAAAE